MLIRTARPSDLARLQEIERVAGRAFRDIGMPEVADDEPLSIEVLAGYAEAGRAWVAVAGDVVAAYLIVDLVDGNVHIEQVSVDPRYGHRGIGRSLIEHAAAFAMEIGAAALTLTTFAEVPWNAPYYRRCGFVVLDENAITPELRALREHEGAAGLDRWPRVCMRRPLTSEIA
ncbi:GNAT family N-acetyltransferase [Actinoplanes sp. NEAU-A12]|uniref:GNAT family N-acetyltransferase n=1 Tax=Actinoplanes sandaracinus TaxID=3045177 RepID=A0ABT6X0H0_9ACTN|nr:GNAT family N-acetyltransferase [Actinoplanes sandaracinus]MDI6105497.1 GNAT family N-acetyltransferase [Actinoplanes sandaracinus]